MSRLSLTTLSLLTVLGVGQIFMPSPSKADIFSDAGDDITDAADSFGDGFKSIGDYTKDLADSAADATSSATDAVGDIGGQVDDALKGFGDDTAGFSKLVGRGIGDGFDTVGDGFKTGADDLADSAFGKAVAKGGKAFGDGMATAGKAVGKGTVVAAKAWDDTAVGHFVDKNVKKGAEAVGGFVKDTAEEGARQTFHAMVEAGYTIKDGATGVAKSIEDLGETIAKPLEQVVNLPALTEKLGKDLVALPGTLNDLSGGLLEPLVWSFMDQYMMEFKMAQYIGEGIIHGNPDDFKKAAMVGVDYYKAKAKVMFALAEGLRHGNLHALETVALMALNSKMGGKLGKLLSGKIMKVARTVKKAEHLVKYAQQVHSIAQDVEDGNYKGALLKTGEMAGDTKVGKKLIKDHQHEIDAITKTYHRGAKVYHKGKKAYAVGKDTVHLGEAVASGDTDRIVDATGKLASHDQRTDALFKQGKEGVATGKDALETAKAVASGDADKTQTALDKLSEHDNPVGELAGKTNEGIDTARAAHEMAKATIDDPTGTLKSAVGLDDKDDDEESDDDWDDDDDSDGGSDDSDDDDGWDDDDGSDS